MQRMQTVTVPGTAIRAQIPASYTDEQVRKALAVQYRKATGFKTSQAQVVNPSPRTLNRPIPPQGNLQPATESWRDKAVNAVAGLMGGDRGAYRMADKVAGVADFVPGVGDALGLNEAWSDLGRGVNTADPYTVGAAMLTGAATLLPGALNKPVRKELRDLAMDESGAIRAYHGGHGFEGDFDLSKAGSGVGEANEKAIWFTPDREEANRYAWSAGKTGYEGKAVYPAEIDDTGFGTVSPIRYDNEVFTRWLTDAQAAGLPGLIFKNVREDARINPADQIAVFDRSRIKF